MLDYNHELIHIDLANSPNLSTFRRIRQGPDSMNCRLSFSAREANKLKIQYYAGFGL
jgi:hypothetical protein